jgi:hypothetical protein
MDKIIKLIEDKFASDECTIYLQKSEIADLKRKLEEAETTILSAEQTIAEQARIIRDLKGESA